MIVRAGLALAERGRLPLALTRRGVRRLLTHRLRELEQHDRRLRVLDHMTAGPIALRPDKPNQQHYELPSKFFQLVLGPRLKYSSALWPMGTTNLQEAEAAMLDLTCLRAQLEDGQHILDLGCGWGSLSLHMAKRFPRSQILALSNSTPQRHYIEEHRPSNLEVVTADINEFDTERRFDRVVSVEMFEHLRNHRLLMQRLAGWLRPGGKLFVHVFCHRRYAYFFETEGPANWMGRYFFTAGLMPSADLVLQFQDALVLESRWLVNGRHYARTAQAWRRNLEGAEDAVIPILRTVYGDEAAARWFQRWRLFFLACEELFGYRQGLEWLVAHYRFSSSTQPVHPATGASA